MALDFDSFVLCASTATLKDEPRAREHADALEFRMDLANDPLSALGGYDGELPILATNRATWEGGNASGSEEERLEVLESATAIDAVEAIDVELAALRSGDADWLLDVATETETSVVVSAHDFETTPSRSHMGNTLRDATDCGDVGKLAVTARTLEDALDVLSVTLEASDGGVTVATMAMGEPGRHTRVVAPVYGSKIGYAPIDTEDATAPGQYDLETLSGLVTAISGEAV